MAGKAPRRAPKAAPDNREIGPAGLQANPPADQKGKPGTRKPNQCAPHCMANTHSQA